MKNKKTKIAIISVVALLLVLIGVTYAYWLVTKTQTNSNIISSACLDITLDNESNDISLSSQYPMSDEDGMKLTPYTFTVTNNCNTGVDYQVALESIGSEAEAIKASALQVALDESTDLLSNRAPVATTVSGAYASHKLGMGTLASRGSEGSSVTHSLRIWIDGNAPISEANKTFQSKISVTIGQGLTNPIKEGTIAYDILSNNDEPTTLSATWEEGTWSAETYTWVYKTSSYWYGTSYTFDSETGKYQLSGALVQAKLEECRNGTKACGEYTLKSSTQDYKGATLYKITSFTNNTYTDTTRDLYMTTQSITSKNDFSVSTSSGEGGLYKTIDDLGESYYFRGDVSNNYVQFGTHASIYKAYTIDDPDMCWSSSCIYLTLEVCQGQADWDYQAVDDDDNEISCVETTDPDALATVNLNAGKDMYWRIVRINGDGTIRLVYDGTEKSANGVKRDTIISDTIYNNNDDILNYGDSVIKGLVDEWYNIHLKTNYGKFITDGIFCNDMEIRFADYYDENMDPTTKDNAYYIQEGYMPYARLYENKSPKLICTRVEDRYTTSISLGNGGLTHPIGLLTADEVFFVGGTTASNRTYYLYSGEFFWTSSPVTTGGNSGGGSGVIGVLDSGNVVEDVAERGSIGARPVINLRADVEFTGDGSFETPYVIKTN